jgi:DMSO/TMAO reductase YedYZ molybdopterin-dependent catalytic subunit
MRTLLDPARPAVGRPSAALAGVLAAAVGLAAGELVAGLGRSLASPVVSIGNRVVDTVPQPVKQLAIDTFGTADKPVLLGGILVVLAALAAGIGVLARRRPTAAAVATGVLGLAGVVAAVLQPGAPLPAAVLPAVATVLVAAPLLLRLVRPAAGPTAGAGGAAPPPTRRRFLVDAGWAALAGVAAATGGRALSGRFDPDAERAALALPAPTRPAAAVPASAHPPVEGLSPFVTDTGDFYRIDTNLTVPRLSAEGWTLRIHGMVERERTLAYGDLLDLPSLEVPITMTCVSNEVGGDLVGTAVWQGVPLSDLLDAVGVDPAATQIVGRAFDGFTTGMPVAAVFDRDALVAYGMNGEPLPPAHGFPLRLVTPGLYGYVSATKWLTELELTTFDAFDQYWVERGWAARAPIRTQARIDTPDGFGRIPVGTTVPVAGVAWAQTRGIDRVEVRVDDGEWHAAELAAAVSDVTWRQWVWRWDTTGLSPGRHQLTVRATDGTGRLQTEDRSRPFPRGASGWHSVAVLARDDA